MEEIWKPWKHNKKYSISNLGRVTTISGKIRETKPEPDGYIRVGIIIDGVNKKYFVHRMVAETFFEDFQEGYTVDHINGIRNDNRVENLRVVTLKKNINYKNENWEKIEEQISRLIRKMGYDGILETLCKIE